MVYPRSYRNESEYSVVTLYLLGTTLWNGTPHRDANGKEFSWHSQYRKQSRT
jgi:hypothetical protein